MRTRASVFRLVGAVAALLVVSPLASLAIEPAADAPVRQAGEDRWVPSLSLTGGTTFQDQKGFAESLLFEGMTTSPVPLRPAVRGDDLGVSPFIGVGLEVLSPALPIPTRPRLFLSGEILPTFASDRNLAIEGDPDCIRGTLPGAPCAVDDDSMRGQSYGEDDANGMGSKTTATVDTLVFGANLGVAFPVRVGKRRVRIKPSFAWLNYKIRGEGLVVAASCDPGIQCTDTFQPDGTLINPGFLRETILEANKSRRFNAVGANLDIEIDAFRYGPVGAALFIGGGAYYTVGKREISFGTSESFDDQIGVDTAVGRFKIEIDPWMYRAHVGVRFRWLGGSN